MSARTRVSGARTIRCLSSIGPMDHGVKRGSVEVFDILKVDGKRLVKQVHATILYSLNDVPLITKPYPVFSGNVMND
jgi:hypothetical protein